MMRHSKCLEDAAATAGSGAGPVCCGVPGLDPAGACAGAVPALDGSPSTIISVF
jgi:hypothetical protein